jgi:predicted ATP-grasp superfamily ATP-dependent carboligase
MDTEERQDAVLIPTGFDPGSYSCVRSLSRRGIRTIIASNHDDVPASGSRFCDETVWIPSPNEDLLDYRDALLRIASRQDVKTILPIRPQDTYLFSLYESEFEAHVSVVTPSMKTLRTVHDRIRLTAAAEAAGVPVPDTRLLSDVEETDRELIVKSRYNLLASEYLDSYSERESATEKSVSHHRPGDELDRAELTESMGHDPIVQEYIPSSDEYVFGALYDHGEALATFQHRQIRGDSYTGGGGVYRVSVDIPELEQVARRLLDSIDYHGLACIEYMRHEETDEFVLTEINPRLWQSLPCAVRAGADFPWYYWLLATGRPETIDPEYEVGVGTHLLYGELGHLQSLFTDDSAIVGRPSVPGTAWEILRSCYEDPNFDNLRFDDPRPFVTGLSHVLKNAT